MPRHVVAGDTAGGELGGTYPNPTVDDIYNSPVVVTKSDADLTMSTNATWTDLDTSGGAAARTYDLIIPNVSAGQWVTVQPLGHINGGAAGVCNLDYFTIVEASPVNQMGSDEAGVVGWVVPATAAAKFRGLKSYQLQAGDIENGSVRLRARYKSTGARVLNAGAVAGYRFVQEGYGPFILRPTQIVFDGQSFVFNPFTNPYPNQLMALLNNSYGMASVGIGGTSYPTRATTAAIRVDPFFKNYSENVLFDIGGQTDILDETDAATILSDMEDYMDARRAAGADIIVVNTIPPATDAWYDAGMETVRLALNTAILASDHWDGVVDIASAPELADPTDTDYFNADGLHLSIDGAGVCAELAQTILIDLNIT